MDLSPHTMVLAVSLPGGMARQYRVQCFSPLRGEWRLYSCFASLDSALQCVATLEESGLEARLVSYAIAPAAA